MKNKIDKIITNSQNPKLIEDAFSFATEAYKDKFRSSGENYIEHAVRVAQSLDQMNLDPTTITVGLLHDVIDDLPTPSKKAQLHEVEKRFGKEITNLVEKISDLSKIRFSLATNLKDKRAFTKDKIENLRKMFFAIAGDLRVILIELVSRIDGLNFLEYLPEEKQKLYALETLQIFVPIANRLGLSEIRRKLEDTSFSRLFPEKYEWIKKNIKEEYEEREKHLKKFIPHLNKILKKERVKVQTITYRAKSYWSTYQKLLRHGMDFNRIHDLVALRIIVNDVEKCYKVLGIIHKHFKPISGEINDYIAKPKPNGYRSLHTTVFYDKENISEIQIRTEEMQKEAEYGICAHWSYKEKVNLKRDADKFKWVEEVPEFWKTFKIDFFSNQVFAFTPKGDVIALQKDSTPIDFAYAVHSDIGNHCDSAKINGKMVPLSHILENGDIVEVLTNKNKKPSKDWLRFVKTGFAKSHIKKIVSQDEPGFSLNLPGFIKKKFIEITEKVQRKKEEKAQIKKERPREIFLAGQRGIMMNIAKCCNPKPGDPIKACLTKYRAAVLHKTSCENFKKIERKFPEKIIDASWK